MVLFVLENVRRHCIMVTAIKFGFVLGLMDYYNAVGNYFPINVKFHFFLSLSLFATCSVFSSSVLKMCKALKRGLIKPAVLSFLSLSLFLKKKFFLMFTYFWDRERQGMNGGGSERGRHRIWNRLRALSCQHRARRGARTRKPWDHDPSWSRTLYPLSHPGVPILFILVV